MGFDELPCISNFLNNFREVFGEGSKWVSINVAPSLVRVNVVSPEFFHADHQVAELFIVSI